MPKQHMHIDIKKLTNGEYSVVDEEFEMRMNVQHEFLPELSRILQEEYDMSGTELANAIEQRKLRVKVRGSKVLVLWK